MNGFQLPQPVVERLNYLSGYFDNALGALVENSIEANLHRLPQEDIKRLSESVHRSVLESNKYTILSESTNSNHPEEVSEIKRTDSILRNLLIKRGVQLQSTPIFESDQQAIMGDDEDPSTSPDIDNKKELPKETEGQVAVPDQSAEETLAAENGNTNTEDGSEEESSGDQPVPNPEEIQQQLTPEQNLQLELAQTDNKFVTLILYEKIVQLISSIEVIKDNISSNQTEDEMDFIDSLDKYKTYLEILNELIFVMDINTIYYNVATIQVEVNDLMDKYLERTKIKKIQSKDSTKQDKQDAIEDLDEIDDLDKLDKE